MVTRASWSSTIRTSGFTPLAPPFLSGRSTAGLTGIDHLEARQVPLRTATADAFSGRQVMGGLGAVGGMVGDELDVLGDEQQMCAWRDDARILHHGGDPIVDVGGNPPDTVPAATPTHVVHKRVGRSHSLHA